MLDYSHYLLLFIYRWYQPELRREDVERILPDERNGVFIVRDYYDSVKGIFMGYVISLK